MAKINHPTTTLLHDTRYQKKDGKYPLKLRITYLGKQRLYSTGIDLSIEDYTKMMGKKPRIQYQEIKRKADDFKYKADDIIRDMRDFSIPAFESQFLKPKNLTTDLKSLFKSYQDRLEADLKAIGTIKLYESTINSIEKFKPGCHVTDVTIEWLYDYQKFMLDDEGNSVTILAIYLRNLRAVINKAIHVDKVMNKDLYPFGKYLYNIPEGNNEKQALDIKQIEKIFRYKHKPVKDDDSWYVSNRKNQIRRARAFFCFSYMANGINFKDIALLKNSSIVNDKIVYYRAKTTSRRKRPMPIKIQLSEDLMDIISKYRCKDLRPESYLFDILKPGLTPKQIRVTVQQFSKTTNKYLGIIADELKIPRFTTYAARHSFATILRNDGAPIELIQESLGHDDTTTTQNYLAGFPDEMKKKWAESLTKFKRA